MANVKKTTRTMRSRQDHQLFKITFPHYDPQTVSMIQLHLGPGHYLTPGQPIATVHLKKPQQECLDQKRQDQLCFILTTYVAGKIEKIGGCFTQSQRGWKLIQNAKKSSLELVHIRQCEHIIKNQSITNSNITVSTKKQTPCDKCPKCNKQIWIYYQSQQQIITLQHFFNINPQVNADNLKQLEWSIILNQQFTPNTVIAKVGHTELSLPVLAKATYLLGEGERPINNVIMKIRRVICKHEKIIDNRCQFCLQLICFSQMQQFSRYLFQLGPNGVGKSIAKGAALLHQEQEYISSILHKKRLILILDLDNTILHSNQMNELEWNDLLKIKDFFLLPKFEQTNEANIKQDYIVIKMRPYLKQFLLVIGKMFEVYVYTKGTRIYADGICRWIRAQWAGQPFPYEINTWSQSHLTFLKNTQCFVPHRVISRNQDTNLETKSMQNILPTRTQYHLILDDRRDVWSNSPSWFFTRQYYYFHRRKRNPQQHAENIQGFLDNKNDDLAYVSNLKECFNYVRQNYPQRSQFITEINERPDYFLLFAAHALRKIHSLFFEQFKKSKEQKHQSSKGEPKQQKMPVISLSYLLQRTKQFLKGKSIRYFLVPGDQSLSTARRGIKLGATMIVNKSNQRPDYAIRGNNYMRFIRRQRERPVLKDQTVEQNTNKSLQVNKNQQKSKEALHSPQKMNQKQNIEEKSQRNPPLQKKEQVKPQMNKKNKLDEQIYRQINQPKPDYQAQLQQLETLHKAGVPIISDTWILASYEYTYKFKIQDFQFQDPFKENIQHSDFDNIIAKTAEKIRIEINYHYSKQSINPADNDKKKMKQRETKSSSIKKQKQHQMCSAQKIAVNSFKSQPCQNSKIQSLNQDKSE